MKRKVTYQVGVDIIGNPIFITHHIIQDDPGETEQKNIKKFINVLTTTFKQF